MFGGNLDVLCSLPATDAALLEDATAAVQRWTQWTTLGNEHNGRQMDGSSCLLGQDVLDCLHLLLCSQELLGKSLDCVVEEARLGHGGI